jgi:hypothetical protein
MSGVSGSSQIGADFVHRTGRLSCQRPLSIRPRGFQTWLRHLKQASHRRSLVVSLSQPMNSPWLTSISTAANEADWAGSATDSSVARTTPLQVLPQPLTSRPVRSLPYLGKKRHHSETHLDLPTSTLPVLAPSGPHGRTWQEVNADWADLNGRPQKKRKGAPATASTPCMRACVGRRVSTLRCVLKSAEGR